METLLEPDEQFSWDTFSLVLSAARIYFTFRKPFPRPLKTIDILTFVSDKPHRRKVGRMRE